MNMALFPDVIVNGEEIPPAAIAAEAQNHEAPKGKPGIAWRKAARALAIRSLLLQEARARAIRADVQELAPGRFETEEEALIRGLLEEAVVVPAATEAEIRAEWRKDPDRFRSAPLWEVSHILCACDPRDEDACAAAESRACGLLSRIDGDPKGFAALAARESDCGSKSGGGNLGQLGPGDTVPEFEAALRKMEEGEISSEPVLSRHGWHIVRLNARADGHVLPYETVRPRIALALEKLAWARASREFVRQLAGRAQITGAELDAI